MAAWNRIEAATQYRVEYRKKVPDPMAPLPPDYDALIDEACVYAKMASASLSVGFDALAILAYLERIQRMREEDANESVKQYMDGSRDEPGDA